MYFDPGFGSMVIQLLIAFIAGASVYAYAAREKLRGLFSKKNKKQAAMEKTAQASEGGAEK